MKDKYKVFQHFCVFQKLVENILHCKIKIYKSDGGKRFDIDALKAHFIKSATLYGVAKQKHCHIIKMTHTFFLMLIFLVNSRFILLMQPISSLTDLQLPFGWSFSI